MRPPASRVLATMVMVTLACGCGDSGGITSTGDNGQTGADATDTGADATADTSEPAGSSLPSLTVDDVDPFIGTGGHGWFAGNALVGASLPLGLVQASPDTTDPELHWFGDRCSGYHHEDEHLIAVSHTHLHGTGIPELGTIGFRPRLGAVSTDELVPFIDAPVVFDKATETASPGHYGLTLSDSGVRVDLTVTERAAVHRYTPPADADVLSVVIDLGHTLIPGKVTETKAAVDAAADQPTELTLEAHATNSFSEVDRGVRHWVAARLDRPAVDSGSTPDGRWAWVSVDVSDGAPVELFVGVSYTDAAHAWANLDAEIGADGGYESVLAAARARWDEALSVLRCAGPTDDERTILATSLYHALLMPNLFSDADGTYRGFDDQIRVDPDTRHYTSLSLWDTYRTLHPLFTLIAPTVQRDSVRSLIAMANEGGWLPKWPVGAGYSNVMIGAPADMVIAESYVKGITDFDVTAAFDHMVNMADHAPPADHVYEGRGGVEHYAALGYVPSDVEDESVSRTLEFNAADYGIAQLAAELGHTDEAERFDARSRSFETLFDAETGFFRPRHEDGSWSSPFDPLQVELVGKGYTEGNAWQYLWMVLHDVDTLVDLLGGLETAVERLTEFLDAGRDEHEALQEAEQDQLFWVTWTPSGYWHGNEPDIHAAWLFAQMGRPDLAAQWLRWLQANVYGAHSEGVAGNDDAGTLAAWYLFATLGFYPIPGSDRYVVATPAFERCELDTPSGTLVVEAPGAGSDGFYAESVSVDGEPLDSFPYVHHAELLGGAELVFSAGE